MEQISKQPVNATLKITPAQAVIWAPERKNSHRDNGNSSKSPELVSLKSSERTLGDVHACKNSQLRYWHARDCLHRANRDLGETAAFIAASLTTVTAIQAVISIADEKLQLAKGVLQVAFDVYIVILVLIFVLGAFCANSAIRRRAQAEQEIDQTKKGIFDLGVFQMS